MLNKPKIQRGEFLRISKWTKIQGFSKSTRDRKIPVQEKGFESVISFGFNKMSYNFSFRIPLYGIFEERIYRVVRGLLACIIYQLHSKRARVLNYGKNVINF